MNLYIGILLFSTLVLTVAFEKTSEDKVIELANNKDEKIMEKKKLEDELEYMTDDEKLAIFNDLFEEHVEDDKQVVKMKDPWFFDEKRQECIEDGDCDKTAVCSSEICQCKDSRVSDDGITVTYAVVSGTGISLICEEVIRIKNIKGTSETCHKIIPTEIFELNDVPISMEFEYKGIGRIHLVITNYEFLSDCGKQALSNDDSEFIKFDSLARFTSNIVNGNELKIMACSFSGSELLIRKIEFVPKNDLSEVIDTAAECREDMATVFYKDTLRTTPADWRTLHITEGQLYDKWNAKWTVENTLPCRGRETWNTPYSYNHCKSELVELGSTYHNQTFYREFRENDLK